MKSKKLFIGLSWKIRKAGQTEINLKTQSVNKSRTDDYIFEQLNNALLDIYFMMTKSISAIKHSSEIRTQSIRRQKHQP